MEKIIVDIIQKEFKLKINTCTPVSGGSINKTFKINSAQGDFFLKYQKGKMIDLFDKEEKGLQLLRETGTLKIPEVIGKNYLENYSFMLLEYLLPGDKTKSFWEQLGYGLASIHNFKSLNFGLEYDNYIGSLPQVNTLNHTWKDFFLQTRILPQISLAEKNGFMFYDRQWEKFLQRMDDFFPEEKPSLLHGDLWLGNIYAAEVELPVLIDPAVYYGHREMEIAFTRLFGGFDQKFYSAYTEILPLEKGFEERVDVYNLYPLLVHVNLFGAGYISSVKQILKRFS